MIPRAHIKDTAGNSGYVRSMNAAGDLQNLIINGNKKMDLKKRKKWKNKIAKIARSILSNKILRII